MASPARFLIVSLFSLIVAFFAGAAGAQGWLSLMPGDGKYAIDMPGTPKETQQTVTVGGAPAQLHQFVLAIGKDEAFVTGYSDFSAALTRSPAELLLEIENGALQNLKGGKLRSQAATRFGQWPGRAFTIALPDGSVYDQQVFLAGNRLYQNIAVTSGDRVNDTRVQHFFASFKILKP